MSTKRFLTGSAVLTAALGMVTLAGAGTAFAHVHADPEKAPKGEYAKIAFRVPSEEPDAGTVRVKVTFPLEHPLSSVRTTPMPGWTARIEKTELNPPVKVAGAEVDEAVRSITWTARPGTRIDPDEFEEFEANLGALPTDVGRLALPTEQTYDSGKVVRWDAPPPADEAAEPEHPAPTLTLVDETDGADEGSDEDPEAAAASGSDDTARWLGGAGLVVGALGLGLGGGALLRGRKGQSS